jgi:ketosteroid isomerase-like protein
MQPEMRAGPNTGGEQQMTEPLNRQRVLSLLDDFAAGDIEAALGHCTDDVDFLTHAPIDILPHMGPRRGKAELREMWKTVQDRYSGIRYEAPLLVAEGDKVAAYLRAFFTKRSNERVVQFDVAVFYTLREGRIAQIREIIDSFDLVQQVLETDIAAILARSRPHEV